MDRERERLRSAWLTPRVSCRLSAAVGQVGGGKGGGGRCAGRRNATDDVPSQAVVVVVMCVVLSCMRFGWVFWEAGGGSVEYMFS